ncbi:hypothetical protein GQ457_01G036200 [Hibiscus cannabinus]
MFNMNAKKASSPDRINLVENVLLAQEIINGYGRQHLSSRCVLKIDLRKTFNSLSWDFILQVLKVLGVPALFIRWIIICVTQPRFSIGLNGGLIGYFVGANGARQGDPLSPYLFILDMNIMSDLLNIGAEHGILITTQNWGPTPVKPYLAKLNCVIQHVLIMETVVEPKAVATAETLLLNAVRGHDVERPSVWLMRQAGRYTKTENVDLLVEISLQPWKVSKPDGVRSGYLQPIAAAADVDQVREFNPEESVPYVGEALTLLQKEIDNKAAVLGFVGAPFTLASYVVEGGSSKNFTQGPSFSVTSMAK